MALRSYQSSAAFLASLYIILPVLVSSLQGYQGGNRRRKHSTS